MSKIVTVFMLYAVNQDRSSGMSSSFMHEDDAESMVLYLNSRGWSARYEEQTYEQEPEEIHDCGDEE